MTGAALGPAAKEMPSIGSLLQGTEDLRQINVSYPKSPLDEDHLSGLAHLLQRGPKSGERAPEAEVTHAGTTTSLFPFLYNPDGRMTGGALLCFDGHSLHGHAALLTAIRAVAPWETVRPRLVLAGRRSPGTTRPSCPTSMERRMAPTGWMGNRHWSSPTGTSPSAVPPTILTV